MRDAKLISRTGLEHQARPRRIGRTTGMAGVALQVRQGLALASILARRGADQDLASRAQQLFGTELPLQPRGNSAGRHTVLWAGPRQWLALSDGEDGASFEQRLQATLGETAAVCDQSDGKIVLRLAGSSAPDVLAKGMPIDLHPAAFQIGSTALTLFGHVHIQIWQVDAGPTYDIAVARSYAPDLFSALEHAGAESGVDILA